MLIAGTNDYAEQKEDIKKHMYRKFKISPLTEEEMQRFLGVFVLLSISSVRNYRQAWSARSSQVCMSYHKRMSTPYYFYICICDEVIVNSLYGLSCMCVCVYK